MATAAGAGAGWVFAIDPTAVNAGRGVVPGPSAVDPRLANCASPSVSQSDGQQGNCLSSAWFMSSAAQNARRHTGFQGCHFAGQVVGGAFRCHHKWIVALGKGGSCLSQGRTVQASAVDGDASATLQQPTDLWPGPDGNTTVVQEPKLDGPGQRLLQTPGCRARFQNRSARTRGSRVLGWRKAISRLHSPRCWARKASARRSAALPLRRSSPWLRNSRGNNRPTTD